MVYRVLVVGEGKRFGLSSSSLYVTVAGENGDSGVAEIPRGESQTEITVSPKTMTIELSVCFACGFNRLAITI